MTYQIFSKLNKGDTITFSQFEEIFKECGTATIKADNARGCKTVSVSDVKTGDKVNNGTRFIEVVAEVEEDETMTENRKYCKRVAEEVEAYVNGEFYRCPECGEVTTFNNDMYDPEGVYTCQECNASFDESDLEVLNIYDYLSDVLDFEYTINSRKEYQSVKVYVTLGGPNVWIDTSNNTIQLRWGSDREEWCISSEAGEEIDSYFEELFNC